MKTLPLSAAVLAAGLVVSGSAAADDRNRDDSESNNALVVAVFGDWPYNDLLLANAGLLISSVNSDPAVSLVIHVGDIHSGSMPCTSAGILPPIPASNPGWNQAV